MFNTLRACAFLELGLKQKVKFRLKKEIAVFLLPLLTLKQPFTQSLH
jgi:hypothetical protein